MTNSVVKGTMTLKNHGQSGGLVHENYDWGWVENNISMMKVNNGEIMYGSGSIDGTHTLVLTTSKIIIM